MSTIMRNVVCLHFFLHQSMDRKNIEILVKLYTGRFNEHNINSPRKKSQVSNVRFRFNLHDLKKKKCITSVLLAIRK